MSKIRIAAVLGAAAVALAGVLACGVGVDSSDNPAPTATARPTASAVTRTPTRPAASTPPPISAEQRNAARDAERYLEMEGYSRTGLIRQLSSDFGDGYTVKAATAAVDSLHVDWNEQAARSAKAYLSMQSYSRAGLIRQLESAWGEGFTHSQAVYGVKAAGL